MSILFVVFKLFLFYLFLGLLVHGFFLYLNSDQFKKADAKKIFLDPFTVVHIFIMWPAYLYFGIADIQEYVKETSWKSLFTKIFIKIPAFWIKKLKP
jgi:hypothetical protein